MSSLIPGYTYDIFISYRQKDNKGDQWVSEFVEALKTELESTFKEEISVYFDINPHDGLLETHDVDESLKDKLKCLIFIPIISRTYCDPKSFAWEHEFKAFMKEASNDDLGLKIKLPNGNVASRVLPVQIHDLDNEDISMCESVLGGVLRGIEFIYKSAGVNRPLRAIEDHPQDNINKTYYRDQINKVANAIKEIISAIKQPGQRTEDTSQKAANKESANHESATRESNNQEPTAPKNRISRIIAGSIAVLALVILGILFIPKLVRHADEAEKWIAVLPFKYQSEEPDKQYLADGMMDAIHLHLSKIEDLRVMDKTSVEQYRGTTKTTLQISKELGVEYLVEGSFMKYEDTVRLIVDLINPGEKGQIWIEQYNNKWDEIFSVQSEVARTIARELNAAITPEEKQRINKAPPTTNLTAYDSILKAQKIYYDYYGSFDRSDAALEKIKKLCQDALELDPKFAQAYYWLGMSSLGDKHPTGYPIPFFLDTALYFFNKAIALDPTLPEAYVGRGYYYAHKAEKQKAIDDLIKAINLSPSNSQAYYYLGYLYFMSRDYTDALRNLTKADEYSKADAIQRSVDLMRYYTYVSIGDFQKAMHSLEAEQTGILWTLTGELWILQIQGKYEEMLASVEKIIMNSPEYADAYNYKARALLGLGRIREAEEYIRLWLKYSGPDLNTAYWAGIVLWMNGKRDEAMKYFNMQIENSFESISSNDEYGQGAARYDLAGVYAFLGKKEEAYRWLREYEKLGFQLGTQEYVKVDPLFENLRKDDEFREIVKRTNDKAAETRVRINELEEKGKL